VKINYGKMMHEIFSEIITSDDVTSSVRKKVIEGVLNESDGNLITERIKSLINQPVARDWFDKGNEVLNEASVLMPDSTTRRPDRIIIKEGRTSIIDFKFGEESQGHLNQIRQYRKILAGMGYDVSEAYLWYVDDDKIITA
jgi:ATP-dependent helicase/nuclease subunit A